MDRVMRRARAEDLAEAQAIARRTIDARYPSFLGDDAVDAFLNSGGSNAELEAHFTDLHVMVEDGTIVAFTILVDDLIHLMMVDETRHREGLGSELLGYAERQLFARHATIRLNTFEGNEQAIRFYSKHGWQETHSETDPAHGFVRRFYEKRREDAA